MNELSPKILVTGATGRVGSEVVKIFHQNEIKVRAGVRSLEKARRQMGEDNVEFAELDYFATDTVKKSLSGIEAVFLSLPFSPDQMEIATRFIDIAKLQGVKHIIFLSSTGARAEGGPSMSRWHRTIERYLVLSDLKYTIVRSTAFMQNFLDFYRPINNEIRLPWSDSKICFIDIRNIAKFIFALVSSLDKHNKQIYTITSSELLTMQEVTKHISDLTGRSIKYVDISLDESIELMKKNKSIPVNMILPVVELHEYYKAGRHSKTTEMYKETTGSEPITFREFCKDYTDEFLEK